MARRTPQYPGLPVSYSTVLDPLSNQSLDYRRSERWRGDSSQVPLDAFSPSDREAITTIYQRLRTIQTAMEEVGYENEEAVSVFRSYLLEDQRWRDLLEAARRITDPPQRDDVDRHLFRQVKHDICGGALSQLIGICQLLQSRALEPREVAKGYLRIRDHTKIMRNGLPELDPEVHARDQAERMHHVDLIVDKWSHAALEQGGDRVDVQVQCDFSGPISDRCVEFSALDRVLYNLMNNATEHTIDGRVELYITASEDGQQLVLAVVNQVGARRASELKEYFGGTDLRRLFDGGYTTGGHGVGLSICAEFVGFAFGVTPSQARDEGYVGARLVDDHFMAWVHWPVVSGEFQ